MRNFFLFILITFLLVITSCSTTKNTTSEVFSDPNEIEDTDLNNSTISDEKLDDTTDNSLDSDEINDEEYVEYIDEDDVEFIEEELFSEDEYLRSIEEISTEESVTQQEFSDDKAAILQIISELSIIIDNNDVTSWLNYLDPESKKYYSNPANLRKAQRKLPNKLIQLKTIKDYFENVFIPARRASKVDEIRYISKNEVKAVEVKEDDSIVVYYYFKKIKDQWYVNLPTI